MTRYDPESARKLMHVHLNEACSELQNVWGGQEMPHEICQAVSGVILAIGMLNDMAAIERERSRISRAKKTIQDGQAVIKAAEEKIHAIQGRVLRDAAVESG